MEPDRWREIIYKALGIPDLVVLEKPELARDLLVKNSELPDTGSDDIDRASARAEAADAVLLDLPARLSRGGLDRALVKLETPKEAAASIATAMPGSPRDGSTDARTKVLEYLLPLLVDQVTS